MLLPDSKTELVRRGNKVVYDLGDKIVKVFNETKPVSDVFNEALNHARINECGIRSPKALEVSQLENANGWALVTEKVPGTTLAEKMTAEPQRFGEYLEMFVDLQIEIHGYTSPLLNRQRDKFAHQHVLKLCRAGFLAADAAFRASLAARGLFTLKTEHFAHCLSSTMLSVR